MVDIFYRLFYHIYKSLLKTQREADAVLTSFFIFGALQLCNVLLIALILDILGINIFDKFSKTENENVYIFIFYSILSAFNYLYFTSNNLYESIIKEYSKKPLQERKRGARLNPFVWFRLYCVNFYFGSFKGHVTGNNYQ